MRQRRIGQTISLIMIVVWASISQATEDSRIEQGRELAQYCVGCHGSDGRTDIPAHPKLAGQNSGYLVGALKAYRDGQRRGGLADIMRLNAKGLSDEDIEALAAYFSSL